MTPCFNGTGLHQPGRLAGRRDRLDLHQASMGPGFISPEGSVVRFRWTVGNEASMGPGFISPEGRHSAWSRACPGQASMGPGFISPEGAVDGNGVISGSEASMGPGFISPEGIMSRHGPACRLLASMGPGFISPEGLLTAVGMFQSFMLQWDRASSARKASGIPSYSDADILLQWDRASSARKAGAQPGGRHRHAASMGPGFISPEGGDGEEVGSHCVVASMGPGYISPEGQILQDWSNAKGALQWDRASSARKAAVRALQWDRASSARKARIHRRGRGVGRLSFNGTGLHQPGRQGVWVGSAACTRASMGPGFISPEGVLVRCVYRTGTTASMGPGFISPEGARLALPPLASPKLQWDRASSARKAFSDKETLTCLQRLQWDRASSARKAAPGFGACSLGVMASMGPGFISPEGVRRELCRYSAAELQWDRASSAR